MNTLLLMLFSLFCGVCEGGLEYRAAFDLGSCLFKVTVGLVETDNQRLEKVLGEKMIEVRLGDHFKKYGTLNKEIEEKALQALAELIAFAEETCPMDCKMKAIATATLRKAGPRGQEIIAALNGLAGHTTFLEEVTAELEGALGLRTAQAVCGEKNLQIAWDSGGDSFQIAYQTDSGIQVFTKDFGGADARALYATQILRMPSYDHDKTPYQDISHPQLDALMSLIDAEIPAGDLALQQALMQENGIVAGIGDNRSHFSLLADLLDKEIYTQEDVEGYLMTLIDRESPDEKTSSVYGKSIAYVVPQTALILTVMKKLNIQKIYNIRVAGLTKGMLITAELWN